MNAIENAAPSKATTLGIGLGDVPNVIHTILLATDGTACAEQSIKDCINLLKDRDGKLVITYFADPLDIALYQGAPCPTDSEWRAKGRKALDYLAAKARAGGIKEVITVLEDHQGEESLIQMADEVKANMIMLSSHLFQFGF